MKKWITNERLEIFLGGLFTLVGVFVFLDPAGSFTALTYAFALAAILGGVGNIALYIRHQKSFRIGPGISAVTGIFGVFLGCAMLVGARQGVEAVGILFPLWLLVYCASQLFNVPLTLLHSPNYIRFSMVVNVVGILTSILLLVNPVLSIPTLGRFIGAYLIIVGVSGCAAAIRNNLHHTE